MEQNDQMTGGVRLLTDEEANAMYGKIAGMLRFRTPMGFDELSRYMYEICWNPEEAIQAIKQACKDLAFPYDHAKWMLYLTAAQRVALTGRLPTLGQQLLQVSCEFSLERRENLFKIDKLISAGPQQYPQREQSPFAHPRLGLFEAGYNPLYGPGPRGYRGFSTSSFSQDGIRRSESQIDLWVTDFNEVRPYFDIFDKKGFDVQHEIAIFETIMEHNCGPNLERRWRFNMVGRWDEGQQVSARLLLETYEVGVETPISSYIVSFGYQPTMGTYHQSKGWEAPNSI